MDELIGGGNTVYVATLLAALLCVEAVDIDEMTVVTLVSASHALDVL